jgi:hypothetical protein
VSDPLAAVTGHLRAHFAALGMDCEPDVAGVTFLGVERIDVLRFGPDPRPGYENVFHHVSLGCSRYPMTDPAAAVADPLRGPRAEIVVSLRASRPTTGLARSLAVVAAPRVPCCSTICVRSASTRKPSCSSATGT